MAPEGFGNRCPLKAVAVLAVRLLPRGRGLRKLAFQPLGLGLVLLCRFSRALGVRQAFQVVQRIEAQLFEQGGLRRFQIRQLFPQAFSARDRLIAGCVALPCQVVHVGFQRGKLLVAKRFFQCFQIHLGIPP